jgi:hypothetical protein
MKFILPLLLLFSLTGCESSLEVFNENNKSEVPIDLYEKETRNCTGVLPTDVILNNGDTYATTKSDTFLKSFVASESGDCSFLYNLPVIDFATLTNNITNSGVTDDNNFYVTYDTGSITYNFQASGIHNTSYVVVNIDGAPCMATNTSLSNGFSCTTSYTSEYYTPHMITITDGTSGLTSTNVEFGLAASCPSGKVPMSGGCVAPPKWNPQRRLAITTEGDSSVDQLGYIKKYDFYDIIQGTTLGFYALNEAYFFLDTNYTYYLSETIDGDTSVIDDTATLAPGRHPLSLVVHNNTTGLYSAPFIFTLKVLNEFDISGLSTMVVSSEGGKIRILGRGFNVHPLYSSICSLITVIDDNNAECTIPPHVASTNNDITFTGNNLSFTFPIEYQAPLKFTISIPSDNYVVKYGGLNSEYTNLSPSVTVDWGDMSNDTFGVVIPEILQMTNYSAYSHTYKNAGVYHVSILSKDVIPTLVSRIVNCETSYATINTKCPTIAALITSVDSVGSVKTGTYKYRSSDFFIKKGNPFDFYTLYTGVDASFNSRVTSFRGVFNDETIYLSTTFGEWSTNNTLRKIDLSGSDLSNLVNGVGDLYSDKLGLFYGMLPNNIQQVDMNAVIMPKAGEGIFNFGEKTDLQIRCKDGVGVIGISPLVLTSPHTALYYQRPCLPFLTDSIVSVNIDTIDREVTITGTHYTPLTTTVTIDDVECDISSESDSEIKCLAPRTSETQSTVVLSNGLDTNPYTLTIDNNN